MNMKKMVMGTVFGVATMGAAHAEWSANVGAATSYIFRGIELSDNAAISGGIDWSADTNGLYVGSWVTSVSGSDELDIYAGYAFDLGGGLGLDLGAIVYLFPGDSELSGANNVDEDGNPQYNGHGNATEIYLGFGSGHGSITAWYGFGLDNNDDDEYLYTEANTELPLFGKFTLGLHVGYLKGLGDAYDDDGSAGNFPIAGLSSEDDDLLDYGISVNAGDFSLYVSNTDGDEDNGFGGDDRPNVGVSWSKSWEGLGTSK